MVKYFVLKKSEENYLTPDLDFEGESKALTFTTNDASLPSTMGISGKLDMLTVTQTCANGCNAENAGGYCRGGVCACNAGFHGGTCDDKDIPCKVACKNGGTCDLTTGKCACTESWEGDSCENSTKKSKVWIYVLIFVGLGLAVAYGLSLKYGKHHYHKVGSETSSSLPPSVEMNQRPLY